MYRYLPVSAFWYHGYKLGILLWRIQDIRQGGAQFRGLYDCACVNPKCYPYDFRTRAPGSASGCSFIDLWRWSGVCRHVLREYIGLQGKYLRKFCARVQIGAGSLYTSRWAIGRRFSQEIQIRLR